MEQRCESTCGICGLVPVTCLARRETRLVANSPAMQALLKRAGRFAQSDAPAVILGETGSGKEVVARALHASSARAAAPFVAVNVAALPGDLLESELFGHVRGAFTGAAGAKRGLFEEANGGTLLLDEIGELSLPLQAKLLRALQDGEIRRVGDTRSFAVDVRIVCATHRDLAELVRQGGFRGDLYFRIRVLTLRVPALRERPEDILPLARQLLADERPGLVGFSGEAEALLERYPWPGNVRELQNAVKHGAALATGARVCVADLPDELTAPPARSFDVAAPLRTLADVEREHILRVLDACSGSQIDAARVLGIARNTLWRKLRSYG
jgi:two-component system response regulator HydG